MITCWFQFSTKDRTVRHGGRPFAANLAACVGYHRSQNAWKMKYHLEVLYLDLIQSINQKYPQLLISNGLHGNPYDIHCVLVNDLSRFHVRSSQCLRVFENTVLLRIHYTHSGVSQSRTRFCSSDVLQFKI